MKSFITGSTFRAMLTDKITGTASTIPYFIVFLETDQCVLCRILILEHDCIPLKVTVNIELSRSISKILYNNNAVPLGVLDFNCFAIKFNVHLPYNYIECIKFSNNFLVFKLSPCSKCNLFLFG